MQKNQTILVDALKQAEAGLEVAVGRIAADGKDPGEFKPSEVLALEAVRKALAEDGASDQRQQEPSPAAAAQAQDLRDWRAPTTNLQRMREAMTLLCRGNQPEDSILKSWIDGSSDELQHFAATHGPAWAQGIGIIDAATLMADQPTEGGKHEMREPLAAAVVVPDGWKLVPVVPTLAMGWAYLKKAREVSPNDEEWCFSNPGYEAALSVAPQPPALAAAPEAGFDAGNPGNKAAAPVNCDSLEQLNENKGLAPAARPHPHHCTARSADGACEECDVHAQDMAEQRAEQEAAAPVVDVYFLRANANARQCLATPAAAPVVLPELDDRAEFESDWLRRHYPLPMNTRMRDDLRYGDHIIQGQFEAWQAGRALLAGVSAPAAQSPTAYAMRWPDQKPNEKPAIFWPEQVADHGADMRAKGQTLTPLYEVPQALAVPVANCYSDDDGDTWRDCPDDCEFVEGRALGEEFELQASIRSWTEVFRVTKVPDEISDDYEVESVSVRTTAAPQSQAAPAYWLDHATKTLIDPTEHAAEVEHAKSMQLSHLVNRRTPLFTVPQQAVTFQLTPAARDVLAERSRQISAEGWTPEHDDEHKEGEMCFAAAGYAAAASDNLQAIAKRIDDSLTMNDLVHGSDQYPWPRAWEFKPCTPRRALVKAGALIHAEIERIDRAAIAAQAAQQGDAA